MFNRRQFLQTSGLSSLALLLNKSLQGQSISKNNPIVVSTWAPNIKANAAAWEVLGKGGRALDAVERGV
ncbi:MAG TPA: glycosylasparaginase, partial [Flavisolibacter sp.]